MYFVTDITSIRGRSLNLEWHFIIRDICCHCCHSVGAAVEGVKPALHCNPKFGWMGFRLIVSRAVVVSFWAQAVKGVQRNEIFFISTKYLRLCNDRKTIKSSGYHSWLILWMLPCCCMLFVAIKWLVARCRKKHPSRSMKFCVVQIWFGFIVLIWKWSQHCCLPNLNLPIVLKLQGTC